jgi:hypothetical protein
MVRGVRHGDPLGPLLFALTLQDVLETASYWNEGIRVIACLDDCFPQGEASQVDAVYKAHLVVTDESANVGLLLQPEKCCVYSANENDAERFGQLVVAK